MKTQTPSEIIVKRDGVDYPIFMSYGLLNRLTSMIGGPDFAPLIAGDPATQEKVLLEVFTKREGSKVIDRPESLDDINVSVDDMGAVAGWVEDHITDFFIQMTEKSIKNGERKLQVIEKGQALQSKSESIKNGSQS